MARSSAAAPFVCDPYTADYQTRLFEIYRELRDAHPVHHNPERNFWMVSRHADVVAVLRDDETFSSAGVEESLALEPMLIYMDGEAHTELRNLLSRGFTPRRVAALEPRVRSIARRLLDEMAPGGRCEFMHGFAAQLPSLVIGELIGIPEERRAAFLGYTESMIETGEEGHRIAEAAAGIYAEFTELLALRRKEPRDDLMSALLEAEVGGERLSDRKLLGFCFLLITGGNDTTMNLIGNGAALLAQHPEQRELLIADPSRIPAAVEEMLRFEAPTQALPRRPRCDVEMHGVTIPAEGRLLVSFGAANHDDRVFDDPDRFDVARASAPHLALGQGAHFCMGASLARLEARVAFEELLERFPRYALVSEPRWVTSRWARSHPELQLRL